MKKYCKNRSIFEEDGHTIRLDKALDYVAQHRNAIKKGSFEAVKENIFAIERYRNKVTHFYCEELEPYIFMLVARSALNFVEFMKAYFRKDIMADEGLFIMPLGFKLPFRPEDFLSGNVAKYAASDEAKEFIKSIVGVIYDLQQEGIEDSIVLGFDIYLESVKKATNSDILAAITTVDEVDASFTKVTRVKFSSDANQIYKMSDSEFREIWKYSHAELVEWCKKNIDGFKQDKLLMEGEDMVILDKCFILFNKEEYRYSLNYSMSVGDVVAIGKTLYRCLPHQLGSRGELTG